MATTIDHLRVDHRIRVLRDFTDATGVTLRAGDSGILRALAFDQRRMEIHVGIDRPAGHVDLVFPLAAQTGPRNGHMRDYFEMGEEAPRLGERRPQPAPDAVEARVSGAVSAEKGVCAAPRAMAPDAAGYGTEGPDRLEAAEKDLLDTIPHIGAAASIAEMYAGRMRAFRAAGDEPRAAAAFKLAVDWMGTYASWATSGGEGVALSYQRDKFHAALAREFGYDPTRGESR